MSEKRIESFKKGYKTCDDLVRDNINKDNPKHSAGFHRTRIAAMDETDFWEGIGYSTGFVLNCAEHPITMYRLVFYE